MSAFAPPLGEPGPAGALAERGRIDAENVEGLVARGALYANKGSLERAIEDFEVALKINAQHKNARKYMCETLFAFGK